MDGQLVNSAGVLTSAAANSSAKAAVVVLPKSVKNAGTVFVEATFRPENAEKVSYLTYFVKPKALSLSPTPIKEEALCIASLFHDVCKVNLYKIDYRNQKIDGEWQSVPYYTVDERFHFGGHGSKSVYQVQYFMKLNQDEAVAINCHMGFSDGSTSTVRDVGNAFQSCSLAWIIHVADEAATYLLDR